MDDINVQSIKRKEARFNKEQDAVHVTVRVAETIYHGDLKRAEYRFEEVPSNCLRLKEVANTSSGGIMKPESDVLQYIAERLIKEGHTNVVQNSGGLNVAKLSIYEIE